MSKKWGRNLHAEIQDNVLQQVAGRHVGLGQLATASVVRGLVPGEESSVTENQAAHEKRSVEHVCLDVHCCVFVLVLALANDVPCPKLPET